MAIPHEKSTGKTKTNSRAKKKCSGQILRWGTQVLRPQAVVPDRCCAWLPGCRVSWLQEWSDKNKLGGPGHPNQTMPTPLKSYSCYLVLALCNPQRTKCTESLLVLNYSASKPAQLCPWDEAACSTHLFSEELEGERLSWNTWGFTEKHTLRTAKLPNSFNQGLPFFICWLCLSQIMFSTNLKKLKTAKCWQAGKKKNHFLQFSYSEKTWSFRYEPL